MCRQPNAVISIRQARSFDGFAPGRKRLLCGMVSILALMLGGCGDSAGKDTNHFTRRDVSVVVTEDAQAALVGRSVMQNGGNAVDAAVATALALSVTMPSRVSLLGGGACLVHDPVAKKIEAIDFLPVGVGHNPVAIPTMMRGLYALHARYGQLRFESLIAPAEKLARFDGRVSRGVVADRENAGSVADADDLYQGKAVGDPLVAEAQAGLLGSIRQKGVGSLYQGEFLQHFSAATGVPDRAIRDWAPTWKAGVPVGIDAGNEQAVFAFTPKKGDLVPSLGLATKGPGEISVACLLTAGGWFGTGQKIADLGLPPALANDGAGLVPPVMMANPNVGEVHGAFATGSVTHDADHDLAGLLGHFIIQRDTAATLIRHDTHGTVSAITCVRDARGTGGRDCSAAIAPTRGGLAITPQ